MQHATDIIDAQLAAYNAGDIAAFAAAYAEDAVCSELPSGRIIANGRAEIAAVWGALFAASRRDCVILNRIVHGAFVTDHERVTIQASNAVIEAVVVYQLGPAGIMRAWFLR